MKRPETYTEQAVAEATRESGQRGRGPSSKRRSRNWDREHPTFAFRVRPEDVQRLADKAQDLRVSRDALARALMWAALDAVDNEWLALEIDEETNETIDQLGRYRLHIRRNVTPAWIWKGTAKETNRQRD